MAKSPSVDNLIQTINNARSASGLVPAVSNNAPNRAANTGEAGAGIGAGIANKLKLGGLEYHPAVGLHVKVLSGPLAGPFPHYAPIQQQQPQPEKPLPLIQ